MESWIDESWNVGIFVYESGSATAAYLSTHNKQSLGWRDGVESPIVGASLFCRGQRTKSEQVALNVVLHVGVVSPNPVP